MHPLLSYPPADESLLVQKKPSPKLTTSCRDAVWALIPQNEQFHSFRPLLEYGRRVQSWEPIPPGVWEAASARAPLDRATLAQLRNSAHNRMLYDLEAKFNHAQATAPEPTARPLPEPVRAVLPALPDEGAARPPRSPIPVSLVDSNRVLAERLLKAGDIAGLRALAVPSNDGYVRRRLAMFYVQQHDLQSLRDLATFSNKACRELAELLARDGDVEELFRQIVCGNGFARRALENWPIEGLQDVERSRILQNGLNADGTVAHQPGTV